MAINPEAELIARVDRMIERMQGTNASIRAMIDEITATVERIDGKIEPPRRHLELVCDGVCECGGAEECPTCNP